MLKALFSLMLCMHIQVGYADNQETPPAIPQFNMGVYLPGINDEINLSDIRVAMDYWLQQLTTDLNIVSSHAIFFNDMQDMANSFNRHELDMISAPPIALVKYFDLRELKDGFAGVRAHDQLNSLILLVKNDKNITNLASLRNKQLLMSADDELSEVFIDTETRKQFQQSYKTFFSRVKLEKKSKRLILDLFFDKADAVLVYQKTYDLMVELNPQIKLKTKVLLSYPLRTKSYGFFSQKFLTAINVGYPFEKTFKGLSENPKLQEILILFKSENLVKASSDELIPIKQLYTAYLAVKAEKSK